MKEYCKQYVRFQLNVQNAVSAQPCVGKLGISHILTFWVVISNGGLKVPKLSIHTLVMLQK